MKTINEKTILYKKIKGEPIVKNNKEEYSHLFNKSDRFNLINKK